MNCFPYNSRKKMCVLIFSILAGVALTLFYNRYVSDTKTRDPFKTYSHSYYKDTYDEGNYVPDDPALISQTSHQYTTIPYRMEFVKSIGKRGCESDTYSKCIADASVQSELDVPEEIQKRCESESNSSCCFPDMTVQSRTEPYQMYSQYV